MTKKEYFKKFFSNSFWSFWGWCVFNIIFGIIYFIIALTLPKYAFMDSPPIPSFYECLVLYIIIYIGALIPSFLIGYFNMNETGNPISDFVSILPIRFLTVVFSLWIVDYHNSIVFTNFSVAIFQPILELAGDKYRFFDFEYEWYYLTSLIPLIITFVGFQFGKKRRKNNTEEIEE